MGRISKLTITLLMNFVFITTCWADADYTLLSKNEFELIRGVKIIEINIVVSGTIKKEELEAILKRIYLRQESNYPNIDIRAFLSATDAQDKDDWVGFLTRTKSVSDEPDITI